MNSMDAADRIQKNMELRDQFLKLNSNSRKSVLKELSSAERAIILKIIKKNGDVHVSQRKWDHMDNSFKTFREANVNISDDKKSRSTRLGRFVDNLAYFFNFLTADKANRLISKAIDRQAAISEDTPIQANDDSIQSDNSPIQSEDTPIQSNDDSIQSEDTSIQKGSEEIEPEKITYDAFRMSRDPTTIQMDRGSYYPSPADQRGETFKGQELPLNNVRDINITLRSDAIPKENEDINSYLTRVYNGYTSEQDCPRGFVFAGCDFMYNVEGKHPALHFLEQHIESLKSLGIKKIYLEQLMGFYDGGDATPEKDQTYLLHQFFNGELSTCPDSRSGPIIEIMHLAKENGIEVIGAEVFSIHRPGIDTFGSTNDSRIRNFNCNSARLIRQVNEPFVVFVGAAHGKLKDSHEPGLADYLDCPCIGLVSRDLNSKVEPGTHRFTEGEYAVDAVFSK